jgi:hypothetical protein
MKHGLLWIIIPPTLIFFGTMNLELMDGTVNISVSLSARRYVQRLLSSFRKATKPSKDGHAVLVLDGYHSHKRILISSKKPRQIMFQLHVCVPHYLRPSTDKASKHI